MANGIFVKGHIQPGTVPTTKSLAALLEVRKAGAWEPVQDHSITKSGIIPDDVTGAAKWRFRFFHLAPLTIHRLTVTQTTDGGVAKVVLQRALLSQSS